MKKKLINFSEYFLVVNDKGQFYAYTDDGYYDGFTYDIHSATIFDNRLFFESIQSKKFDFYSVHRLFVFRDLDLEVKYD